MIMDNQIKMDERTQATSNEPKAETTITHVSVKPPLFWKPYPHIWFVQLKAHFWNHGVIADQMKYDIVISSIEAEIL